MANQEEIKDEEKNIAEEQNAQDPQGEQGNSENVAELDEEIALEEEKEEEDTQDNDVESELQEFKNKYLRLYSEFENYRKRTSKEKADLITTASSNMILEVLPIVDDFERAMRANEDSEDVEGLKEGFRLIYDKLFKTLEKKGLKPINAKGEDFDTELHEAVTQFPAPSEELKGKVIEEVEKGYTLGEKVVRFSKVVVGQ